MNDGLARLAAFLIAVVVSGCASQAPTTPDGPLDQQVVLAPGELAVVAAARIRVGFLGVFGDSRCPADAVCIQGGDAIVRIVILTSGRAPSVYDLHTGDMRPIHHDDLTIALEELSPYPFSSRTIAPGEYRAALRVRR
jgi:hypothetical protein